MDAEATIRQRWTELTDGCMGPDVRNRWWDRIRAAYSESHRHYHTLAHLAHMFKLYDQHKDRFSSPVAVAYAILFHDIVYDPKSKTNEMDSVNLFNEFANETKLDERSKIVELIEATASHLTEAHMNRNEYGNSDIHYFLDFDMAILGASDKDYEEYAKKIRLEYSHMAEGSYRMERAKLLRLFTQIPHIFATEIFRNELEQKARVNLQREIDRLSSS